LGVPKLNLTLACGPYDRFEALRTGAVQPEGITLDLQIFEDPRALFDQVMSDDQFDVAEMSTSEHIVNTVGGDSRHVALPVFPSRMFRHGFIITNRRSGIKTPKDLAGRRIGVPLYTMKAAVWIRGMLEDEHGVDLSDVTWVQGAVDKTGSHGVPKPPSLLKPIKLEINSSQQSLDGLLVEGKIDAMLGALLPPSLGKHPDLVRLFPDYRAMERDYYRRTGIHPIMHLVVIRKPVFEANPWIAKPLYRAFVAAKAKAWEGLGYSGAPRSMLPWALDEVADTIAVFGGEPFVYGLERNRRTLETFAGYLYRHHMIGRLPRLEELFVDVGE
jgi:4,5-dihydroxyphthalate decarboxylase